MKNEFFLAMQAYRLHKKRQFQIETASVQPYKHQPYCWQVGLHQSLRPLRVDAGI